MATAERGRSIEEKSLVPVATRTWLLRICCNVNERIARTTKEQDFHKAVSPVPLFAYRLWTLRRSGASLGSWCGRCVVRAITELRRRGQRVSSATMS